MVSSPPLPPSGARRESPPALRDCRRHRRAGSSPFFHFRSQPNKISVCHPERSRSFSERRARKNRGAIATMGSPNEFGWLLYQCNIPSKSHRDFKRDPASPRGSRFCIAIRSTEVRQAQDDRLIDYSIICVRRCGPPRTSVPTRELKIYL